MILTDNEKRYIKEGYLLKCPLCEAAPIVKNIKETINFVDDGSYINTQLQKTFGGRKYYTYKIICSGCFSSPDNKKTTNLTKLITEWNIWNEKTRRNKET